jgi:hypothetical protein
MAAEPGRRTRLTAVHKAYKRLVRSWNHMAPCAACSHQFSPALTVDSDNRKRLLATLLPSCEAAHLNRGAQNV